MKLSPGSEVGEAFLIKIGVVVLGLIGGQCEEGEVLILIVRIKY